MKINAFVKNYKKGDNTTQVLTVQVVQVANGVEKKIYKNYFLNYSKNKGTCYLSDCGE